WWVRRGDPGTLRWAVGSPPGNPIGRSRGEGLVTAPSGSFANQRIGVAVLGGLLRAPAEAPEYALRCLGCSVARQRCEGSDEIATDRVRVADAARPELTGQDSLDHHAHLTRRDGAHLEAGLLEREAYGPASLEPVQLGPALEPSQTWANERATDTLRLPPRRATGSPNRGTTAGAGSRARCRRCSRAGARRRLGRTRRSAAGSGRTARRRRR